MIYNFFIKNPLPKNIPDEMEEIIETLKKTTNQQECLKKAYEIITEKYYGGRIETYSHVFELLKFDISRIWGKTGFLHCTHQNQVLRILLIGSEKFEDDDIEFHWTSIWILSPHQYVTVRLENNKQIIVDCWGKTYGIKY